MVVAEEGGFWPTGAGEAFQRFVVLGAQLRRECVKDVGCGCGAEVWRRSWERAQARDVGIMVEVCGGWAYVISELSFSKKVESKERKNVCVVGE